MTDSGKSGAAAASLAQTVPTPVSPTTRQSSVPAAAPAHWPGARHGHAVSSICPLLNSSSRPALPGPPHCGRSLPGASPLPLHLRLQVPPALPGPTHCGHSPHLRLRVSPVLPRPTPCGAACLAFFRIYESYRRCLAQPPAATACLALSCVYGCCRRSRPNPLRPPPVCSTAAHLPPGLTASLSLCSAQPPTPRARLGSLPLGFSLSTRLLRQLHRPPSRSRPSRPAGLVSDL